MKVLNEKSIKDVIGINNMEIKDVNRENVDDLTNLCIPEDKRDDPLFIEGKEVKKKWATQLIKRYGNIAKLAYTNSKPTGMIQYLPKSREKLVEITCIFVPEEHRKGIGKALLNALLKDMKETKPYFDGNIPFALVTWAFDVPGWYPQHEFYQKMGFKRAKENDPFLLYYPIKEGYIYAPKEERFIPQEEDEGKVLIFYDPSCPFSIYFNEKIREFVREIDQDIPIRIINKFEEVEEVKKRGAVSFCVVNKKPIESFFLDKENFQREVKEALGYGSAL